MSDLLEKVGEIIRETNPSDLQETLSDYLVKQYGEDND